MTFLSAAGSTTLRADLATGSIVGARRWPFHASHPDAWERPWLGKLLNVADPRAWARTIAFPMSAPHPASVRSHVEACLADGRMGHCVPVLWQFSGGPEVRWEAPDALRLYDEDVAEWAAERTRALEQVSR